MPNPTHMGRVQDFLLNQLWIMIEILLDIINQAHDQIDQSNTWQHSIEAVRSDLADINQKLESYHLSNTKNISHGTNQHTRT